MPAPTPTDVILVARGEPADQSPEHLGRIREAVTDASVLLVAPALPVLGERWIIDLDARASQARSRLSAGSPRWPTTPWPSRPRSAMPIPERLWPTRGAYFRPRRSSTRRQPSRERDRRRRAA